MDTPFGLYPNAIFLKDLPRLKTFGNYKLDFPEGAIVHYTAGRQDQSGIMAIQHALENNYCYFFINESGMVYQQFNINRWGSHAGLSKCPVTCRSNVSKYYVGIEIACAGLLNKGKTWYNLRVPDHKIRVIDNKEYEAFTPEQEESLFDLSMWLCLNGANPNLFFGHNEVTPRKIDPAGSLSISMEEFRIRLKENIDGYNSSDY